MNLRKAALLLFLHFLGIALVVSENPYLMIGGTCLIVWCLLIAIRDRETEAKSRR